MKLAFITIVVLTMAGCAPHPYTQSSLTRHPQRPLTCDFQARSTLPSIEEYEEVGTIGGCSGTTDLGEYKRQVAEKVCLSGGDLLVGDVNGYGVYCRGIVFRKRQGSVADKDPVVPLRSGQCLKITDCQSDEYCNSYQRCCHKGKACQAP